MVCPKCNKEVRENANFCEHCGNSVFDSLVCPNCGNTTNENYAFCRFCGTPLNRYESAKNDILSNTAAIASKASEYTNTPKALTSEVSIKRPFSFSKKWLAALCSIAALLVILVICIAIGKSAKNSPLFEIASATENTLAAKNFTVDFKTNDEDNISKIEGTAYVSVDLENRDLTFYADITTQGESGTIAIYDGYYIVCGDDGCWGQDIRGTIEQFFKKYEESVEMTALLSDTYKEVSRKNLSSKELIEEFMLELMKNVAETAYDNGKLDVSYDEFVQSNADEMEQFFDEFFDEIDDGIDLDKFVSYVRSYEDKICDLEWLEDRFGYSTEKDDGITLHSFEINAYKLTKDTLNDFKPAFLDKEAFDELLSVSLEEFHSTEAFNEYTFGVKAGKLVYLLVDASVASSEYGKPMYIEADFYDIGKTDLHLTELKELLDKADLD